jgi:general secretion pathway protein G
MSHDDPREAQQTMDERRLSYIGARVSYVPPPPETGRRRFRPGGWVVGFFVLWVAGALFPRTCFLCRAGDAQASVARSQMVQFKAALALYQVDNGTYPTRAQGLDALITQPTVAPVPRNWLGPYMDNIPTIPRDPWGNSYEYGLYGPPPGKFRIICFGRDGRPGGTGLDADLYATSSDDSQGSSD